MWCPDGFISLAEIYEKFAEISSQWRLATPNQYDVQQEEKRSWLDFNVDLGWDRELAYKVWLMNCFLNAEEGNLYAAHPNGNSVKLSTIVVRRGKVYDGDFQDDPQGWRSIIDHLKDPFMFVEDLFYTIDLRDVTDSPDMDEWAAAYHILKPLDRCPVCWKMPTGSEPDWKKVCGIGDGEEGRRPGRPSKVGKFAAAYKAEFPNGSEGKNRKAVLAHLQRVTGISGSLDTLDRAMAMANDAQKSTAK
ncbi:hypothetical protein RGQ15_10160 [Paracoccus sp. MBLB3053]|uniref:Uncharacterized protein n=1 Tax=Paracoccus aurantius TaxID=3073814 RepID=A0ABU2HSB0_9RHOB|nr:hypothetical protein [Paracoccus sp. MBLB3053]MDS9467928.1 hypothetical protein [Paracoccus sp. MBLB3053]